MINDKEMKFIRLALDPSAHKGEIENAAVMLINSLRARGVMADQFRIGMTSVQNSKRKYVFPDWGKNASKEFDDIDPSYLQWILRKWFPSLDEDGQSGWQWLRKDIEEYLRNR
jgi:hypothetical protein